MIDCCPKSPLRNADLNAGSWVIQQFDVIPCPIRHAKLDADARASEDVLIPFADSLVGLIFCACRDCKFRGRRWNEIRQREPGDPRDTEDCGHAFEET